MQDPTIFQSESIKPHFPEQEQLKCPRCDSTNTKFCYYNNYNLSQPRHFCKNCKRYWTKGGALRNIPVGGGTRKNPKQRSSTNSKRSSSSSSPPISTTSSSVVTVSAPESDPTRVFSDQDQRMVNIGGGSFSSLLASNSLLGDLNSSGLNLKMAEMEEFRENVNSGSLVNSGSGRTHGLELEMQNNNGNAENFLSMQSGDSSYWNGSSNGWSNLAIYTPGSSFQ